MASSTFDTALNTALNRMTPTEIRSYTAGNASKLQNTLTNQIADTFGQSLALVDINSGNYDIMSNYTVQSNNLDTTIGELKDNQGRNLNIARKNVDTSSRVREIKEWYYNNKLDTLFVFQLIFISLCALAVIAYLSKLGFIGGATLGILIGLIVVILVLTIANRAVYTDMLRDKRYWSKRINGIVGSPLPGGIIAQKCP
jgi:hypothetical protein